jgi:hypothetical protein
MSGMSPRSRNVTFGITWHSFGIICHLSLGEMGSLGTVKETRVSFPIVSLAIFGCV